MAESGPYNLKPWKQHKNRWRGGGGGGGSMMWHWQTEPSTPEITSGGDSQRTAPLKWRQGATLADRAQHLRNDVWALTWRHGRHWQTEPSTPEMTPGGDSQGPAPMKWRQGATLAVKGQHSWNDVMGRHWRSRASTPEMTSWGDTGGHGPTPLKWRSPSGQGAVEIWQLFLSPGGEATDENGNYSVSLLY